MRGRGLNKNCKALLFKFSLESWLPNFNSLQYNVLLLSKYRLYKISIKRRYIMSVPGVSHSLIHLIRSSFQRSFSFKTLILNIRKARLKLLKQDISCFPRSSIASLKLNARHEKNMFWLNAMKRYSIKGCLVLLCEENSILVWVEIRIFRGVHNSLHSESYLIPDQL